MANYTETKERLSLDVKIIGWILMVLGSLIVLCGFIAVPGTGRPEDKSVFFRLICLDATFKLRIYLLTVGPLNFVSGFGLLRGKKYGWLICLITQLYFSAEGVYSLNVYPKAYLGVSVNILLIVWLIFRKDLFWAKNQIYLEKNSDGR